MSKRNTKTVNNVVHNKPIPRSYDPMAMEQRIYNLEKNAGGGGGGGTITSTTLMSTKVSTAEQERTFETSLWDYDYVSIRYGVSSNDPTFPERQINLVAKDDLKFIQENNLHFTISIGTKYITFDIAADGKKITTNVTSGMTIFEIVGLKYGA